MTQNQPIVIAFLSGKGGSGKTTTAIAMARLLSAMGEPCLLIDFDLATHGASYFFQGRIGETDMGVFEAAVGFRQGRLPSVSVVHVEEHFGFVPAAIVAALGETDTSLPTNVNEADYQQVLESVLDLARSQGIGYVLLDCQAGYNTSARIAARAANLAIIVAEADSISSDTADDLVVRLGSNLPPKRKYLITKIDVRDAETYRSMKNVFQTLNRLPPLPFDFAVRNAFGARQMPVDLDKPTPFLFALLETSKYAFPELHSQIEKYRTSHIDALFAKYEKAIDALSKERAQLRAEKIEQGKAHRRRDLVLHAGFVGFMFATMFGFVFMVVDDVAGTGMRLELIVPVVGSLAALTTVVLLGFGLLSRSELTKGARGPDLGRLQSIERQLDDFRSLAWTHSKEYLFDAVVAGEADRMPQPQRREQRSEEPN